MKRKNFTMIDNKMLTDMRLKKHHARDVWMGYKKYCNKDMHCYPSARTVAKNLGLSHATVKRAIKLLKELGYMSWINRVGTSYYTLYYEPCHQTTLAQIEPPVAPIEPPPAPIEPPVAQFELGTISTKQDPPKVNPINKRKDPVHDKILEPETKEVSVSDPPGRVSVTAVNKYAVEDIGRHTSASDLSPEREKPNISDNTRAALAAEFDMIFSAKRTMRATDPAVEAAAAIVEEIRRKHNQYVREYA